jgi:hypothetical protein
MLRLASLAYCEKHYHFARSLVQLATEAFEHAGEMDRSEEAQAARASHRLSKPHNDDTEDALPRVERLPAKQGGA